MKYCPHCGHNEPDDKKPVVEKRVPFTIYFPSLKPGQGIGEKEIQITVRVEDGEEILTIEAQEQIEFTQIKMMIDRLSEAVRELFLRK